MKTLVGSSVVFGAATLLSVGSRSVCLMLTRVLAGIGLGASIRCAMALAAEAAPEKYRATVPVFTSACIQVGVIVASLAAAAVMPVWGWRCAALCGRQFRDSLSPSLWRPCSPDPPSWREEMGAGRYKQYLGARYSKARIALTTVVVCVGMCAVYVVTFFFGFWLPTLLNSMVNDIRTVGLASAFIKTFSLFGSLLLGRLMDRCGAAGVLPLPSSWLPASCYSSWARRHRLPVSLRAWRWPPSSWTVHSSGIIGFSALVFPTRIQGHGYRHLTIGVARVLGGTFGPMMGGVLEGGDVSGCHQRGLRCYCLCWSPPSWWSSGWPCPSRGSRRAMIGITASRWRNVFPSPFFPATTKRDIVDCYDVLANEAGRRPKPQAVCVNPNAVHGVR